MVGFGTIKTVAVLAGIGIVAVAAWRLAPRGINWLQEAGGGVGQTLNQIGSDISSGLTGFTGTLSQGLQNFQLPTWEWPTAQGAPTGGGSGLTGGTTTYSPEHSTIPDPYVPPPDQPSCGPGEQAVFDAAGGWRCLAGRELAEWSCQNGISQACDYEEMGAENGEADMAGMNDNTITDDYTNFENQRGQRLSFGEGSAAILRLYRNAVGDQRSYITENYNNLLNRLRSGEQVNLPGGPQQSERVAHATGQTHPDYGNYQNRGAGFL